MLFRPTRTLLAIVACLSLTLAACSSSANPAPAGVKPAEKRTKAPDFALRDADGKTVRLADYRGKVVLLNFFATWCAPCRIEIPWFMELEQQHKDRGFAVLGIALDEEGWEVVKPYITRMRVNYRVLMGDNMVSQLYGGVDSLPTTFVIDREGRVASVHVGLASKGEYQDDILAVMETSESVQVPAGRVDLPALLVGAK